MARLRQQFPQNYGTSGNIQTDFENIVRYLNSAELGDKTLSELMATLFNDDGEFDGPVEFRLNQTAGLEYRIGEYRSSEDGWKLLANIDDIRGPAGQNFGMIEGPIIFNRQDIVVTANDTALFSYVFDQDVEDILVLKNGILLRGTGADPEYIANSANGTVTLTPGNAADEDDVVTIFSIRAGAVSNYRRLDYVSVGVTAVVPFAHTEAERLMVYKNGILQREGPTADYVRSSSQGTITFLVPLTNDETATILTVENLAVQNVAGLMLEDEYTDENGYILYGTLAIEDGEIPQAKIASLSSDLNSKAKMTIASSPPVSPTSGDLWLDISIVPNVLKFYSGTQWLSASPDNALPSFLQSDANKFIKVNGAGTAYEYGLPDNSALVPKTYIGAANGVASLDSTGKIPVTQMPEIFSVDTIGKEVSGSLSNTTYYVTSVYKQKLRIDGITAILNSGTCQIQLAVDGVGVGTTYAVSSTRTNQAINPVIEIDGTLAGKDISIIVTSNSSGNTLRVGLSSATLNT